MTLHCLRPCTRDTLCTVNTSRRKTRPRQCMHNCTLNIKNDNSSTAVCQVRFCVRSFCSVYDNMKCINAQLCRHVCCKDDMMTSQLSDVNRTLQQCMMVPPNDFHNGDNYVIWCRLIIIIIAEDAACRTRIGTRSFECLLTE